MTAFTASWMQGGIASQIIANILTEEMNMPANSVWLRDQNKTIPNDNGLYIAVGMTSAQTIGNVTEVQTISDTQYEVNMLQQRETIQIDIFASSETNQALFRNWEVIAALQSLYSQQQQELNNFKILRIPNSFLDTSSAEGGSVLQRYSITIMALVWYRKQKLLGTYYDDFTVRCDDEKTIGTDNPMLEFEITADTPPPLGD
jgi:hypothetical protein